MSRREAFTKKTTSSASMAKSSLGGRRGLSSSSAHGSSGGGGGGGGSGADLSDSALLKLSVKDLNVLLKSLPPDERLKLKKKRRILKNRGYAANCRTKRMSQKEVLEMEKEKLENDVKKLRQNNQMMRIKLESIRERFKDLQHYTSVLKTKNN